MLVPMLGKHYGGARPKEHDTAFIDRDSTP